VFLFFLWVIQSLNILIDIVVFDYIPFPVLTHTTGMTHFQKTYLKVLFKATISNRYFRFKNENFELGID